MSESGELRFKATGDESGFMQMLSSIKQHGKQAMGEIGAGVSKSWGGIGKGMIGGIVGALSFEAVKGSLEQFLDRAKYIKDLSEQMDMGAQATQKWEKASDRLGLSFGGMQSVLTSIAQARQEALTDPKAAEKFERLGISRKSVLDTKGVDNSEFAKMVLNAGRSGDENRAALGDIVGKRGLKYAATAEMFDKMSAPISDMDMAVAEQAEQGAKKIKGLMTRFWSGTLAGVNQLVEEHKERKDAEAKAAPSRPAETGVWRVPQSNAEGFDPFSGTYTGGNVKYEALPLDEAHAEKAKRLKEAHARGEKLKPEDNKKIEQVDLAKEAADDKKREQAEQIAESEQRIENAKRAHMNKRQKLASEKAELAKLDKRIADSEAAKAPGGLKGMDLEDWKVKQTIKTNALKADRESMAGSIKDDMKEKPLSLSADSLTKSGLVSVGGANFSTSKGTERAQLDVLRSIDRKIAANNPWKM